MPGDPGNQYGGTAMLHLLWTALIGLIVGAIAKFIIPGKDPGGIWITMLIGIAGSFIGTWIGRAVGHYDPDRLRRVPYVARRSPHPARHLPPDQTQPGTRVTRCKLRPGYRPIPHETEAGVELRGVYGLISPGRSSVRSIEGRPAHWRSGRLYRTLPAGPDGR